MAKRIIKDIPDEEDLVILGISTTLKDYGLAYYINKVLSLNLVRGNDLKRCAEENEDLPGFPFFLHEKTPLKQNIYLIGNKNKENWLIPELKLTDFLLVIKGPSTPSGIQQVIKTLRQIPNLMAALRINMKEVKQAETFLADFDFHTVPIRQKPRKSPW